MEQQAFSNFYCPQFGICHSVLVLESTLHKLSTHMHVIISLIARYTLRKRDGVDFSSFVELFGIRSLNFPFLTQICMEDRCVEHLYRIGI